jgi:hypothetical protein
MHPQNFPFVGVAYALLGIFAIFALRWLVHRLAARQIQRNLRNQLCPACRRIFGPHSPVVFQRYPGFVDSLDPNFIPSWQIKCSRCHRVIWISKSGKILHSKISE